MTSLKQRSIDGMFWTVSERLGLQIVNLVVLIVLARLLEPSQFGLISMLAIFTAVGQSILDSGFGSALIQKKDADQTDSSSIFFFNLLMGFFLAGLLFFFAPLIAKFYSQESLIPVSRVISISFIINAFSLVQVSLLTKRLDFQTQMKVSLIAAVLSGIISIILAFYSFGAWSLVAQILTHSLFRVILLWIFSDWRPALIFNLESLKTMFPFGSRMLFSGLLNTAFENIYETFIGRVFSATDLGFFSKAKSLESAATRVTSYSLGKVVYPAMAPHQDNIPLLQKAYRKTICLAMFLHLPLMVGLWAVADPLLRLLLTDKWAPSIPYFQILCVVGIYYPLHTLNLNILQVKGRSDLFFRLEILKKLITVVFIVITYRYGILVMLYGNIVDKTISYFLNSAFSKRLANYGVWDQIKDLLPSILASLVMGTAMYFVGLLSLKSNFFMVILQGSTGILVYLLLSLFINRNELKEVWQIVYNFIQRMSRKVMANQWHNRS